MNWQRQQSAYTEPHPLRHPTAGCKCHPRSHRVGRGVGWRLAIGEAAKPVSSNGNHGQRENKVGAWRRPANRGRTVARAWPSGTGWAGEILPPPSHNFTLEFRCKLVEALLLRSGVAWRSDRATVPLHMPVMIDTPRACAHCSPDDRRSVPSRDVPASQGQNSMLCVPGKALCFTAERNCFEEYHKALFRDSVPDS